MRVEKKEILQRNMLATHCEKRDGMPDCRHNCMYVHKIFDNLFTVRFAQDTGKGKIIILNYGERNFQMEKEARLYASFFGYPVIS